jgi:hypothetical protein
MSGIQFGGILREAGLSDFSRTCHMPCSWGYTPVRRDGIKSVFGKLLIFTFGYELNRLAM